MQHVQPSPLQRFAKVCVSRWELPIAILGNLAILGFLVSLIAVVQHWIATPAYAASVALCLAIFTLSLVIGHLGSDVR